MSFWILPTVAMEFGFGQLFKWSQRQGYDAPLVVTVNYLTLTGALALYLGISGQFRVSAAALQVGGPMGAAFVCSLLSMTRALGTGNVGAVLTAFRLSIALPVVRAGTVTLGATDWPLVPAIEPPGGRATLR